MKRRSTTIFISMILLSLGCLAPEDKWNLMEGPYLKHGEFIVYKGYWIESYKDTNTQSVVFLLVQKENNNFISDSLRIGTETDSLSFDYGTVNRNGQQDHRLVVLYTKAEGSKPERIIKAWSANIETGKFEPASTEGITVADP